MMKARFLVTAVAGLVITATATAQTPSPFPTPANRPNLSPYLNLLRGGSPAANYYLGVVPEAERRAFTDRALDDFQNLYRRTARLSQELEETSSREPLVRTNPPTGHPTGFQYYGTYFKMPGR
jgi:hypothetical protein